jgi:hypothetical protein
MIVVATERRRYDEPAPRRDPIGWLLLHRIEYTDANPWVAVVGLVLSAMLGGFLNLVLQ